ncbi:uncharacterized [Tachysurus ichikawai]
MHISHHPWSELTAVGQEVRMMASRLSRRQQECVSSEKARKWALMPGPVAKAPSEARTGLNAGNEPNPGPVIKARQKDHSVGLTLTLLLKEVKDC